MSDLGRLLDELEQAYAKATPGPWDNPEYTSSVYGGNPAHLLRVASGVDPDDAELIVAAVNAVPVLVAELRRRDEALAAVEAWAAMHDDMAREYDEAADAVTDSALVFGARERAEDCRAIAEGVRRVLAAHTEQAPEEAR